MAMLLGEKHLSIFDIAGLVAGTGTVALSDLARSRIARSREIVARYTAGDEPIYGLNTGLGGNLGHRLSQGDISAFQTQLVRGRNIGVGEPLPPDVCRAALLSRIVSAASGGSGLSQTTINLLIAMFNAGVTPVIPARGSISAADLGLSAHIGAVVIGRGRAWFAGEDLPGSEALALAGLKPVDLEPKDGLALCNNSVPGTGHGAMTLAALGDTILIAATVAALACQGYGANPAIFDARLHVARPASGQVEAAVLFRRLLDGSSLHENPRNIQDAVSFRTLAPVMGATFAAFGVARDAVETELNGISDSPLVLLDDGLMLSSPSFHTAAIALAFDTLAIGLTHLATASAYRIFKLMNPALSGLPKYLSPIGGASAGYVPMQKTVAALHAEIRLAATPASLDSLAVSDTVEDHAPQTLMTVRKLAGQLVPFKLMIAIEALVAAQAVDLRAGLRLSPITQHLHGAIRAAVPMLEEDREPGIDVMAVHAILDEPDMIASLRRHLADLKMPFCP
jgi:histidine ammonia-lyase